ncbi:MAG: STAS/SEC14 domain-containing protein [Flavobacteriales bacterium]|uniref:STAS/SEC14 domain-containing protein n=3 Tax=Flavobacteriales TaxID=200644 RepID=A0A7H0VBU6_9FLAO|nr:STAS/SEC14 domain-containing protein [Phaeocystidibacter marisrubri]KAB2816262.1 STAS/SEC14 domain-containing protein [Phaeocystidibacter marisrubri]MAC96727.1 STAS/SEC14 domain-containing protein [Flavobacteriales bacterium]QNR23194.1 STAS/SEC14 domain-containing protein [Croceimicrobium hydrocarbonivorans]|tara:strand:- start:425 stop:781 length:357 start_codon:yes stop_codon:yes gene_type:complete
MMQIMETKEENLIAAKISGKISKKDVERFHPLIHNTIEKGQKVDFYFELEDFDGYELEGLWEDLKVDTTHLSDYGKMAFVGDKKWQEWAAKATDFFTDSEVRFFHLQEKKKAKEWISQ